MLEADEVRAVVDLIRPLIEGDGARLDLLGIDGPEGVVRLGVDVTDVECEECLMPADTLTEIIDEHLRRTLPGFRRLELTDPRVGAA